ncbi:trafficking protein particle complex subunit 8-like [Styela clava]
MAESLKSTHDFIKSAFSIRVGVLSSQDAEFVSQKNNLSFSELIQPFCTLTNEAKIQGIGAQVYRAYNVHVRVSDIRQKYASIDKNIIRQMIADLVSKSGSSDNIQTISVPCKEYDLSVNRSCPWMDTYRDMMVKFGPPQDHEFLNHHIACMLVVSSLHPNPMQEFANLSQLQNHIQHGEKNNDSLRWMTPNTLKYFVLLHDAQQSDDSKAKEVFATLQATYGTKVCHFLCINSRNVSNSEGAQNLPDPWHQFMNSSTSSLKNNVTDVAYSKISTVNGTNSEENQPWFNDIIKNSKTSVEKGFGCCLTMADHDGLQSFMHDFIVSALIPHMEKTIKNINDQLSARKALHKSLFRATRTLFGSSKSPSSVASTSGYSHDANELLLRKIADLCFLSQMYDQAFYFYHNAKKDYTNDQAWLYAAGASEMAATSNFMQRNTQKTYPSHYMESAITMYIDVCKNDYLALRCSLIHAECLQFLGQFNEAAFYLIKVTNETDDLRSALLLEQAAHSYLKMKEPQPKKFAFHLILAGHRFSKCAQRAHALRSYNLALQVYLGQGWSLAEDHINFAMARQSFNMKHLLDSSNSFRSLLVQESSQPSSQQAAFFHEFIHIFQQCEQLNDAKVENAMLGLPKLLESETKVCLDQSDNDFTPEFNTKMSKLVNLLLDSEPLLPGTVVSGMKCFCKSTSNVKSPQLAVGEVVNIEVTFQNYLDIPICMSDITIKWDFKLPEKENSQLIEGDIFQCSSVPILTIPPLTKKTALFTAKPLKPGVLTALGTSYKLGLSSSDSSEDTEHDTSYSVKDYQPFNILGRRLNKTKDERCGVMYGTDQRLNFHVLPVLPKMSATFDNFPTTMVCNEVVNTTIRLQNTGNVQLDIVKILANDKVQFTICGTNGHKFILPNVITTDSKSKKIKFTNVLSEPLLPGKSVKMDVCIKAPATSGIHQADALVYCKSNCIVDGPSGRTFFIRNHIECTEGVDILAELMTPVNQENFIISLRVRNASTKDSWMLFIEDVTCSNSSCVVEIVGDKKLPALSVNNHLYMYLNLAKKFDVDSEKRDLYEPPEIIIHWKGGYNDAFMYGQHQLDLKDLFEGLGTFSTPETMPVKISDNMPKSAEEFSLQTLHRLVTWRLRYNSTIKHDFTANSLCHTDMTLMVYNLSNLKLHVTVSLPNVEDNFGKRQSHTDFAWVGATEAKRLLAPHSEIKVNLKACFARRGVFNVSGVSVTAIPMHLMGTTPQIPQKPPCGYFINIE